MNQQSAIINSIEAELILFLLDDSKSMGVAMDVTNIDSPSKSEVLDVIVKELLKRINDAENVKLFKIGIIRFSNGVNVVKANDKNYFTTSECLKIIRPSTHDFNTTEVTDIACAFEKANEIADEFYNDSHLPNKKACTLIICTDGKHFEHEIDSAKQIEELQRFINSAEVFKTSRISTNVVCVTLGSDADIDALIEISSIPTLVHQQRFANSQFLQYLKKDNTGQYRLNISCLEIDGEGKHEIETILMTKSGDSK